MRRICSCGFILIGILVAGGHTDNRLLHFYKKIGVGGGLDWTGWMSFVAFSPDGTMVASDGPTAAGDSAGQLAIWSFPGGQLIRKLPYRSGVISDDWRYFLSDQDIVDLQSGMRVLKLALIDIRISNAT